MKAFLVTAMMGASASAMVLEAFFLLIGWAPYDPLAKAIFASGSVSLISSSLWLRGQRQ
jgi:hypothetical protein